MYILDSAISSFHTQEAKYEKKKIFFFCKIRLNTTTVGRRIQILHPAIQKIRMQTSHENSTSCSSYHP